MHEKTHRKIRTVRPLRDGVIADFEVAEQMIRGMIKKVKLNGTQVLVKWLFVFQAESQK